VPGNISILDVPANVSSLDVLIHNTGNYYRLTILLKTNRHITINEPEKLRNVAHLDSALLCLLCSVLSSFHFFHS
jgi:hypothetical protein